MTLRDAITRATGQLSAHPALRPTALADAALLLMHTLGIARPTLIAHPERHLSLDDQASYQRLLERRLAFEPIQYITGTQEFYGLTLRVTPAVLIPRPETELLVESVLTHLSPAPITPPVPHSSQSHRDEWEPTLNAPTPNTSTLRILDVGTGSGAIAIALAHHLPQASVTAVDLSPDALALASENAATHHLRIRFLLSDLLDAVASDPPYDAIVSNPPYIADSESPSLHPQVRDHEPAQALFSGPSGLEIYERLIPQALALLKPGGLLALEFGHGQRDQIAALLSGWHDVTFLNDLQQIPRVALARRPSPPAAE